MFKRQVQPINKVLQRYLRLAGLETPLQQRRLISAWPSVTGVTVARYTDRLFIKNQTLYVHITNAALRSDLSLMRAQLVKRLNAAVGGGLVIADIHLY